MIDRVGQRIEKGPGSPWPAILSLLPAAAFLVLAVTYHLPVLAVLAVLPLAVAGALWLTREPPFAAEVGANGLEVLEPPLTVPYAAMHGLTPLGPSSGRHFAIAVEHPGGTLVLPARLNVPARELFAFLAGCLPEGAARPLPPALEDYRRKQEAAFGPGRVYCFRARPLSAGGPTRPRSVVVATAVAVAGLVWTAVGLALGSRYSALTVFGAAFLVVALLVALLIHFDRARRQRRRQDMGLVISPVGLALISGSLRGELLWEEVKGIASRGPSGIVLTVEGATIVVTDMYDQPLTAIHQQLCDYWEG